MNLSDIGARIRRLEEVSLGLGREIVAWQDGERDPLLYVERRQYLDALARARSGLEDGRVALARARQRIEAEAGARPDVVVESAPGGGA